MGEAGEDGLRAAALSVARFSSMYEWTRCDRVIDYDAYVCLRATMTVAVAVRHRVGGPRSARAAASQKMPPPPPGFCSRLGPHSDSSKQHSPDKSRAF